MNRNQRTVNASADRRGDARLDPQRRWAKRQQAQPQSCFIAYGQGLPPGLAASRCRAEYDWIRRLGRGD